MKSEQNVGYLTIRPTELYYADNCKQFNSDTKGNNVAFPRQQLFRGHTHRVTLWAKSLGHLDREFGSSGPGVWVILTGSFTASRVVAVVAVRLVFFSLFLRQVF